MESPSPQIEKNVNKEDYLITKYIIPVYNNNIDIFLLKN